MYTVLGGRINFSLYVHIDNSGLKVYVKYDVVTADHNLSNLAMLTAAVLENMIFISCFLDNGSCFFYLFWRVI